MNTYSNAKKTYQYMVMSIYLSKDLNCFLLVEHSEMMPYFYLIKSPNRIILIINPINPILTYSPAFQLAM